MKALLKKVVQGKGVTKECLGINLICTGDEKE
jgi:hypothetical protein